MGLRSTMLVLTAWAASLTGCAGTPPSRFYGLCALPASQWTSEERGSFTVGVTRVTLPEFLDKPQIATRLGPNEIRYDEFNRWAEPLKDNLSRVLTENLAILLGGDKVLASRALSADYHVWVEVIQFDAGPRGDFTLSARWTLYRHEGKKVIAGKRFDVLEQADEPGYVAMSAAGSRAVAGLSREIAKTIGGTVGQEQGVRTSIPLREESAAPQIFGFGR